jgi:hypothetical protein
MKMKAIEKVAVVCLLVVSGVLSVGAQSKSKPVDVAAGKPIRIVPGKGLFVTGTKRIEFERLVGKGKPGGKYDKVYYIYYPKAALEVSFDNKTNRTQSIFMHTKKFRFEPFTPALVETTKGIGWNATVEDVLKAYGKPRSDFGGGKESWRRLVYVGIDFMFEGDKLERIGVLGPDEMPDPSMPVLPGSFAWVKPAVRDLSWLSGVR